MTHSFPKIPPSPCCTFSDTMSVFGNIEHKLHILSEALCKAACCTCPSLTHTCATRKAPGHHGKKQSLGSDKSLLYLHLS